MYEALTKAEIIWACMQLDKGTAEPAMPPAMAAIDGPLEPPPLLPPPPPPTKPKRRNSSLDQLDEFGRQGAHRI